MLHFSTEQIEQAIDVLSKGEVIVFPTETSYGLGCDATNAEAVRRIFEIKGRPNEKGLPLIIPSAASAPEYVLLSEAAEQLAAAHWPGALNLILPVAPGSPVAEQCEQDGTQSVRVSSHPFAATLVRRFEKPIVATSANVSGKDAIYSVADVHAAFRDRLDQPDLVIDGGVLPPLPASTTVRVLNDQVDVLRQGAVVL